MGIWISFSRGSASHLARSTSIFNSLMTFFRIVSFKGEDDSAGDNLHEKEQLLMVDNVVNQVSIPTVHFC